MKPLLFFLLILMTSSVQSQKTQQLMIHFQNRFGEALLVPEQSYIMYGDTITINRFKYYVSHFELTNEQGKKIILPVQYYLIDAADSVSGNIILNIPIGQYRSIHFLLGVDSLRNVSGVQSGALDPLHGMFWTWNSGYIMAKLEGTATSSQIAGKQFTYHIGGFRGNNNTARSITLPLSVTNNKVSIITDAKKWFERPYPLIIAKEPVCHSPGTLAVSIANNYVNMFSILSQQK
ncbi:MAG: MbnP family protein [Sediminibacterium sp.]|uniref:MbnP family protein n=1 Tax=Sediminibacterium sp. TaxID=1917865 RepID=UPI002ABAC29D|nr:MbnP family protein [Sediminibacterium sp.]MDZ4072596.1 MbnP family protein [Sediminibacterium sp.]